MSGEERRPSRDEKLESLALRDHTSTAPAGNDNEAALDKLTNGNLTGAQDEPVDRSKGSPASDLETGQQEKAAENAPPARSTMKITLIMSSLCVSKPTRSGQLNGRKKKADRSYRFLSS